MAKLRPIDAIQRIESPTSGHVISRADCNDRESFEEEEDDEEEEQTINRATQLTTNPATTQRARTQLQPPSQQQTAKIRFFIFWVHLEKGAIARRFARFRTDAIANQICPFEN